MRLTRPVLPTLPWLRLAGPNRSARRSSNKSRQTSPPSFRQPPPKTRRSPPSTNLGHRQPTKRSGHRSLPKCSVDLGRMGGPFAYRWEEARRARPGGTWMRRRQKEKSASTALSCLSVACRGYLGRCGRTHVWCAGDDEWPAETGPPHFQCDDVHRATRGAFPTGQMPQMLPDDGISGARKERLAGQR